MAIAKPDMTLLWGQSGINVVQPANQQIIDGWIAEKPPYQTENWVQNRSDEYLKHVDSLGVPAWGSTSEYDLGSMAMYNNQLWESIQANNVNHLPADGAGWWQSWQPLDKKRGGVMQDTIQFINNRGIAGEFTDASVSWLTYLGVDNNVYMGAINDPSVLNTSTYLMQGGVVRADISAIRTQFNHVVRSTVGPSLSEDLTRKDYVDNGDVVTLASANSYTDSQIGIASMPVGGMVAWPVEAAPVGFLHCRGQAVSRTVYANLFALLGTSYGVGDGSTTFNLPDYQGEFLRGRDNGKGSDPDAVARTNRGDGTTGDAVGTKQLSMFASHIHSITGSFANGSTRVDIGTNGTNRVTNTNATGGNETRGRNVNVNWIIKT